MSPTRKNRAGTSTVAMLVLGCALLQGCTFGSPSETVSAKNNIEAAPDRGYPPAAGVGEVLLYRRSSNHLVAYSIDRKAVVFETKNPQTFQYAFRTPSPLYISGDSASYGFRILRTEGTQVHSDLEIGQRQGVFPLAVVGDDAFVSVVDYDEAGQIARGTLALYGKGGLTPVVDLTVPAVGGAVLGDTFYYTVPAMDASATFDLYSLTPGSSSPKLVRQKLASGKILAAADRLLLDDALEGTGITIPCDYECTVDGSGRFVFSLRPGKDQDLTLSVFDATTGDAVWTVTGDVIDYRHEGEKLTVYLTGRIVSETIGGLR